MMKEGITAEARPQTTLTRPEGRPHVSGAEQLAQRIRHQVRMITGGRIHNLSVVITGTHVVLHGFCSTFHCYQLAQHAAMNLADDLLIDNRIDVL